MYKTIFNFLDFFSFVSSFGGFEGMGFIENMVVIILLVCVCVSRWGSFVWLVGHFG